MNTVFHIVLVLYLLAIALLLWFLWYDRERVLRSVRKAFRDAGDLLKGQSPPDADKEAKKAERGLRVVSEYRTSQHQARLLRVARAFARAGIQLGWLAADPPRWDWPRFSPTPQRPWDWKVDR